MLAAGSDSLIVPAESAIKVDRSVASLSSKLLGIPKIPWQAAVPRALFARSTHLIYPVAKFVTAAPHYLEVFGGVERA